MQTAEDPENAHAREGLGEEVTHQQAHALGDASTDRPAATDQDPNATADVGAEPTRPTLQEDTPMTDRSHSTQAGAPIDDGANRDQARGSEAGDGTHDRARERQDRPPGRAVQSPAEVLLSMLDQEMRKVRAHPDLGPTERARALVSISREARKVLEFQRREATQAPPGFDLAAVLEEGMKELNERNSRNSRGDKPDGRAAEPA